MQSQSFQGSMLDNLVTQKPYVTGMQEFLDSDDPHQSLVYWLGEFSDKSRLKTPQDAVIAIQQSIADLDELINDQLNFIIHHPRFQALESSWRGLKLLVDQADGSRLIKIKLLDINWSEVSRDIGRALEFDQSLLFKKIYSDEYGTPGGEPFGVIIGDYEVSHQPSPTHKFSDIETLTGLSQIAAASFAPFVAGASPELFGLDDFATLAQPINLHNIFAQKEYIKWNSLRSRPETQFVGLTLPRMLMREPYRTESGSYGGIYFKEHHTSPARENYCWGNAAYGFGLILIREFANVGWFGHIRGVPRNQIGGGLLENLPADHFNSDPSQIINKPVTDVIISDIKERDLSDLGFISLCQCYDTPYAAFYSNQSLHKPETVADRSANINARLSAMLQHVLCGSRIAHYIKVIIRDKIGSFITADECEDYLRNWLFKYTTGREDLEWDEQARYPLREAAVTVKDHPEKPGDYVCVMQLKPHYQLDHMVSELELITELAQGN